MNIKSNVYTSADLLRNARISYRQLYHWESKGLLAPFHIKLGSREFKRYRQKDLDTAMLIRELLDEGYALPNLKMLELILRRKQIEEELKFRLRIEEALYNVSDNFVDPDNFDLAVNKSLGVIREVIGVNRVYIFEYNDNLAEITETYKFSKDGEPINSKYKNMPVDNISWFAKVIEIVSRKESIIINDVELMENLDGKKELKNIKLKTLLIIPLFYGEKLFGFMGFDDNQNIREWNSEDITILKTAANIFTRSIIYNRKQA
ncbi:MAG: MerR family transcriptional regulator [Candidatus Aureabacteria bacterium]|nr:MerR family transcriptional regulator [Candidatus Auribacterota bacterium]